MADPGAGAPASPGARRGPEPQARPASGSRPPLPTHGRPGAPGAGRSTTLLWAAAQRASRLPARSSPPAAHRRRAHQPSHHTRTARLPSGAGGSAPPAAPCPFRIMAPQRRRGPAGSPTPSGRRPPGPKHAPPRPAHAPSRGPHPPRAANGEPLEPRPPPAANGVSRQSRAPPPPRLAAYRVPQGPRPPARGASSARAPGRGSAAGPHGAPPASREEPKLGARSRPRASRAVIRGHERDSAEMFNNNKKAC